MAVVFAVNGERFELRDGDDPGATLLDFLRSRTRFTGPKLGCGEGGCGACVVLLSTYDAAADQVSHASASSCLTLAHGLHHRAVTTTEGLGNSRDGLHAVHARLAGFHASQCGFCTPGMCMSLAAALAGAEGKGTTGPPPREGFSRLTSAEAERAVAGNLCRCTGYRPIADACKSFAADVDLEDLGLNSFWKKGDAHVSKLPPYKEGSIGVFPEFLKAEIRASLSINRCTSDTAMPGSESSWHRPQSVEEYYKLIASDGGGTKVVAGNTSSGVYREAELYDRYIDLRDIPELNSVCKDTEGVQIGAATSISRVIEILRREGDVCKDVVFGKIADHMEKVASHFVRNTASLGGNLVMAQRDEFPSDIATILLAAGSSVCIQVSSEKLNVTLDEFLEMPPCDNKTLLLSIFIPHCTPDSVSSSAGTVNMAGENTESSLLFETYRAAPRPLGNAVAYLNSAFFAQVSSDGSSGSLILENLRLAFGAYGTQHAIRARDVEKCLVGKPVSAALLLEACKVLKKTIVPKEGTTHSAYRSSLAVAFLFSFLYPATKGNAKPARAVRLNGHVASDTNGNQNCPSSVNIDVSLKETNCLKSGLYSNDDILESCKQIIEISKDYLPVGIPTKKIGAELQASGEAVYVDDIPSPEDCLYGAFIYSTKPLAHVNSIELDPSLEQLKTVAVITVKDIPKGGGNVGANTIFGPESLFGDPLTQCAGEPLGIVVAETRNFANIAAKRAVVNYSTETLDTPILSIEEAVRRCSYFETPPFLLPQKIGDFSKEMEQADQKIYLAEVKLSSQYYFYMETQTALAIPDEDNCMVVYSSSQCPEAAQNNIAKCLGLPCHNVRVITRRVGGGFGGKAVRSLPVATACALAAFKLRRPVRMYLDRKTDMIMTGGRHPMKICYSIGFKSDGKITALHVDLFINAGMTMDVSPIIPHNFIEALKKYNWGAFSYDAKICKTNFSTRSAMRGPGEVQGSYVAEAIIEHVASALSTDAKSVRQRNIHTVESLALFHSECMEDALGYTLPSICNQLTASANYQHRLEMIQAFNKSSQWKKRGLSFVPIVHKVLSRPTPGKVSILNDGSIVVEVGGIEIGQGLWTKVKQMTAFGLGQLWADQTEDLLERIRIIQADTLSVVQGGWTTGSTTSECSCEAVRRACSIMVDRLKPLKEQLQEKQGRVSWDALISQAKMAAVDLSAREYYIPGASGSYLNYGAAASEVEIDLLTGATTILRSDLISIPVNQFRVREMGENDAVVKDMAAQLAAVLQVQVEKGWEAWSQLHGKLAEVAAAVGGDGPRTAVQALLKVAKDASSSQALMRTLEERVSTANPDLVKYLVFLVADELKMTPIADSDPVYMVYEDKIFCEKNVDHIIGSSAKLSAPNAPYAVVSIIGAQSSGKSYLLNRLFGTRFPEMDATRGWSRTTRGIMISRCIGPSLLVLDVEGFDGRENEQDTRFEKQAALFALTVSDLMIVNMNTADISRDQGGGSQLFRTIFQERSKIERAGLTKILVVLRNYNGETPLEILRTDVLKRMQMTWESVNVESMKFEDYIEVDTFGMPDKESPKFPKEVAELRRLLSKKRSAKVPASSFTTSSKIFWDTIMKNEKLDIPSHQVFIARLYCQRLVKATIDSLDSLKDYKVLKVEESPSCFKRISDALLESITTRYDLETKMYDPKVRDEERQHMVDKLYKIFTDDSKKLILKVQENTLEKFKSVFDGENVQKMKEYDANLYRDRIVDECKEKFMSSCKDLKVFDSENLDKICGDLEEKMQSYTALQIAVIKEKHATEKYETLKAGVIAFGVNVGVGLVTAAALS